MAVLLKIFIELTAKRKVLNIYTFRVLYITSNHDDNLSVYLQAYFFLNQLQEEINKEIHFKLFWTRH